MARNQSNDRQDRNNNASPQRFESDTQRLVRKHLSDKNHVISDEDIKNLRVGMTPPLDEGSRENFEKIQERMEEKGQQATPWDTINKG